MEDKYSKYQGIAGVSIIIAIFAWLFCVFMNIETSWFSFLITVFISFIILSVIEFIDDYKEKRNLKKHLHNNQIIENNRINREFEITKEYGECDLEIKHSFIKNYSLRVYYDKQIVILNQEEIKFSDIVGCSILNRQESEFLPVGIVETPTKNTSGIVGRALVGGAIAGPAGAVIGGLTAKDKTKLDFKFETTIKTRYSISLNTTKKDQNIVLDVADDLKFAKEIKEAIDGILSLNNKNKESNSEVGDICE